MTHSKPHYQDAALDAFVGNITEISAIRDRLFHEGEYAARATAKENK